MDKLISEIMQEYKRASNKFPPFNSAHEGYAVLQEEVDELWCAVKVNQTKYTNKRKLAIKTEAIQVAAMAIRFLHDICGEEIDYNTTDNV